MSPHNWQLPVLLPSTALKAVRQCLPCFCGGSASSWHHFGNHRLVTAPDIYVTGYTCQRKVSDKVFASGGESPKSLDAFSKRSFLPSCLCGSQYFWFEDHCRLHQHPQYLTEIVSLASSLLALDWRHMQTQTKLVKYKNTSRYSGEHVACSSGNQYQWPSQRGKEWLKTGISGKRECPKPFTLVLNIWELYILLGENGLVCAALCHDFFPFLRKRWNRKTAAVWENSGHYVHGVMTTAQTPPESTCGMRYFVEGAM